MAGKVKNPPVQISGGIPRTYDEFTGLLINETTGIISDFQRQYVGAISQAGGSSAVFMNFDPVVRQEFYKQWAQYDLYWYLEQDTHIGAILSAAKVNVVSLKWDVRPYRKAGGGKKSKPTPQNEAIADFVKESLQQMETLPQHLYDLMDALPKGFSFSEIMWTMKDGFWVIDRLLNRTQRRIQFDAQSRAPRIRTLENPFYGDTIPVGKYIVHRCSSNWENPFGDAVDQSLYWMWLFKREALKFWLHRQEVDSGSTPIVKHPAKATPEMKNEAMAIAQSVRNGAYGHIPDNFEIFFAEAKTAAAQNDSSEKFVRLMNDEMTKRVKGGLLTTEGSSSTGTGSRAMGQTHAATEDAYDKFRAQGLAASMNKYLIKFLVDYNFANVEGYPRFTFDAEEEEDLEKSSAVLVNLSKALPDYDFDPQEITDKFGYTLTKKEKQEPAVNPNIQPVTIGMNQ